MVIVHEDEVPYVIHEAPYARTVKRLISPALQEDVDNLKAGITILPSSSQSNRAKHEDGELFYVVSGSGRITVGDDEYALRPGTTVWVPPNVFHQLINSSAESMKVLWVLDPPEREAHS